MEEALEKSIVARVTGTLLGNPTTATTTVTTVTTVGR